MFAHFVLPGLVAPIVCTVCLRSVFAGHVRHEDRREYRRRAFHYSYEGRLIQILEFTVIYPPQLDTLINRPRTLALI